MTDGDGGAYSALSNAMKTFIEATPPDEPITNRQLATQVHDFCQLVTQGGGFMGLVGCPRTQFDNQRFKEEPSEDYSYIR